MRIFLLATLLLFPHLSYPQGAPTRQRILQFDEQSKVARLPASMLTVATQMDSASKNQIFLSGVGGVSFDQTAQQVMGMNISTATIDYLPSANDGQRLQLFFDGKPARVLLPDWLLVPIAKYADGSNFSCFTLFGKLNDEKTMETVLESGDRILNYHPQFDNTLLGLRLAYMDMLLVYQFSEDLPKNSDNSYILGPGENQPNVFNNNSGHVRLFRQVRALEQKYGLNYRSYVVSDFRQKVLFKVVNDSLEISGLPFFYCWRFRNDAQDYDLNKKEEEISSRYLKGGMSRSDLIECLLKLGQSYEGRYAIYSSGTFNDMISLNADADKRAFLNQYDTNSLLGMAIDVEVQMDAKGIEFLGDFSRDLSSVPELFEASNPAVWNATVSTMRYAAFFRYLKQRFPTEWARFLTQIRDVDPEPRVFTPTVLYDPNHKSVESAVMKTQ